jgi:hypothetical protein
MGYTETEARKARPAPHTLAGRVRRKAGWEAQQLGKKLETGVRRLTAPLRALPGFIIIGTQKGGTTSLYRWLADHPQVVSPWKKEIHFFDYHFDRGEHWYRSHFPLTATLRSKDAITGEASPYYIAHPHAARRIASVVPDARLILLLRNPASRAVSHYWHTIRSKRENNPMDEAFRLEPERLDGEVARMLEDESYFSFNHHTFSYLLRGHYAEQVARYLEHFDRSQLLILQSEALFRDNQGAYDQVLRFLGLAPQALGERGPANRGKYRSETPPQVREMLQAYFEPHNRRLYDLLGLDTPWW